MLVLRLSAPSASAVPVPGSSARSAFTMLVLGLSAPSASIMPVADLFPRLLCLDLRILLRLHLPSLYLGCPLSPSVVPVPGLSTLFASAVFVPGSSAPCLSASAVPVAIPGLSPLPFPSSVY